MSLLGIPDPWIWGSYVSCFVTVAFCIAYGYYRGRTAGDDEEEED